MSISNFVSKTVLFAKNVATDIKSLKNKIGNLNSLNTAYKTDLVGAINEVGTDLSNKANANGNNLNDLNNWKTVLGINSSSTFQSRIINLSTGYNTDTWYPVVATIGLDILKLSKVRVQTTLGTSGVPPWATHPSGFVSDFEFETIGGGWGVTQYQTSILRNNFNWLNDTSVGRLPVGMGQMTNPSLVVIYLRGGGIYEILSNYSTEWGVKTSLYTEASQSVAPQQYRILEYIDNITLQGIKSDYISTYNYGDAQKWFEAYNRGDYRTFGLGRDISQMGEVTSVNPSDKLSGFYAINQSPNYTEKFQYGATMIARKNDYEWFELVNNVANSDYYLRNHFSGLLKIWHEGNFNPSNYATTNEINNIYDQLNAKANTRLSNIVSNLSYAEQTAIKSKTWYLF